MPPSINENDSFRDVFEEFVIHALSLIVALSWKSAIDSILKRFRVIKEIAPLIFAILMTIAASIFVISVKKKRVSIPKIGIYNENN